MAWHRAGAIIETYDAVTYGRIMSMEVGSMANHIATSSLDIYSVGTCFPSCREMK